PTWPTTGHPTPLPTYPFQRQRYWLDLPETVGDATDLGQAEAGHPLLGAAVELPDDEGVAFTGRLSLRAHPWLADHAVHGTALLPGTAFAELALHAGQYVGCERLEELNLQAPLLLPEQGAMPLQVTVGAPDGEGRRPVTIHSRRDEDTLVLAKGTLAAGPAPAAEVGPGAGVEAFPPEGATPVDLEELYGRLASTGLGYGPAFQGLSSAWRLGDEVYAEVTLDNGDRDGDGETEGFGIHPALLDAALHPLAFADDTAEGSARLPVAWSDVSLHAVGARAVRVRLTPTGADTIALAVTDHQGTPVAEVGALTVRETRPESLVAQGPRDLYELAWTPLQLPQPQPLPQATPDPLAGVPEVAGAGELAAAPDSATVLAHCPDRLADPAQVRDALAWALDLAQAWLAEERFAESRLVVVTRDATGERPGSLAHAAVWGLLRSAQTENPGRFALVDLAGGDDDLLAAALGTQEPQVAVRDGALYAPRLARTAPATETGPALDPDGVVLVTGATGALGGLVARHLVTAYGVKRLLLVSRRGPDAPGAAELRDGLTALGAEVTLAACDLADRAAVAALLDAHPGITGIIHAAGALDDATIPSLTPERLDTVLRAKADAAWHLHERAGDVALFALFSSVSGVFGGAGQGNYAAANAYLDALAAHRRAQGLPAVSYAWGLWDTGGGSGVSGMTGQLAEADRARMARSGILPISGELGLELFDAGLRAERSVVVPVRLEPSALRDPVPLLRGLVRTPARRAAAHGHAGPGTPGAPRGAGGGTALVERLAGMSAEERTEALQELVRDHVADVLGHSNPSALDIQRGLLELGIDSLTAVELRNRLGATVGHRLPTTLIFDHPTIAALAAYLDAEVVPATGEGTAGASELDRLEKVLLALAPEDEQRVHLARRLQEVLVNAGMAELMALAPPQPDETERMLGAASDDEIFDFIDNELGELGNS
ncbi:SDR family NAD(P)-dependent oxidoreductase, partial [Streptomyces sp. 6N223]|uniref:SDR family NAD(P)-dependent oxidoreductase n=1 Tax=Streptomyces sp. 6N223 TaxID=3457412 RepID=UPI003FD53CF4